MPGDRHRRLFSKLMEGVKELDTERLCEVCVEATGTSGAGIMIMSGDIPTGSLQTTNDVSALIEELQFALREGPCLDAFHQRRPILEPDLANPSDVRWMAFSGPALEAGVRAIFGFPLHVGEVRLGALNLYRDSPGPLSAEQHADALAMADIVTRSIIVMQAHASPGQLALELEVGADLELVVHQATGMVAAQLGVSVAQALIRLQAYAFGNDRPLRSVATEVVARGVRFAGADGVDGMERYDPLP